MEYLVGWSIESNLLSVSPEGTLVVEVLWFLETDCLSILILSYWCRRGFRLSLVQGLGIVGSPPSLFELNIF